MSKENLIIREANINDLKSIIELYADDEHGVKRENIEKIDTSYTKAFKDIQNQSDNTVYIVEIEKKVIATYQMTYIAHLNRLGSRRAQIESMHVDDSARGQGIGEIMINHAINEAKNKNCKMIQLTTHQDRKEAHRFYERLDFVNSHFGMKLYLKEGIE